MTEYTIVSFKRENRKTMMDYLETHFKKQEVFFGHQFETNAAQETIVFEAQKNNAFNKKMMKLRRDKKCSFFSINKSIKGLTLSRLFPRIISTGYSIHRIVELFHGFHL